MNDNDNSMTQDDGDDSRRSFLRKGALAGGVLAIGGSTLTAAQSDGVSNQQQTPTETESGTTTQTGPESGSGDTLIEDLVDATFGYPLSSDESGAVDFQHEVEATMVDGEGSHPDFPSEPEEDAPGQFVEIPAEFFFDPVGIHVHPDDLIRFQMKTGLHTVTAYHEKFGDEFLDIPTRVPEDVPGFTSPPQSPGESWVYQFSEKGVYDLFCFPHLGLGMVMRVVTLDPDADDIEDETFEAPTAGRLFPNDQRVLQTDELDPAHIVEAGTVSWDELTIEAPTPTPTPTETETGEG